MDDAPVSLGEESHVGVHHQFDQRSELGGRLPPELPLRLAGVSEEHVHFGGTGTFRVDGHVFPPIEPDMAEGKLAELSDRAGLSGGDDVVARCSA